MRLILLASRHFKRISFISILIGATWFQSVNGQDLTGQQIAEAAFSLTQDQVVYDPSYFSIDYPNGDVPKGKGVCTDVVIRTFRKFDVDLQKLVHEDMKANFGAYPPNWGLSRPDPNIDHRRVPNLQVFFKRNWKELSRSSNPNDYKPGDIVSWNLGSGLTHIGVVSDHGSSDGTQLIVHNIGAGQVLENCLFNWEITGHFRYP